jgi:hypothetical protein
MSRYDLFLKCYFVLMRCWVVTLNKCCPTVNNTFVTIYVTNAMINVEAGSRQLNHLTN